MQQEEYTAEHILRVAKRHNNKKRKYILVNPWQGKHVPVSPVRALSMMKALGNKVAMQYGEARLVIGFAETATAIGAVVARVIHPDCLYVQTTRENMPDLGECLDFLEEHSHAPEQKLAIKGLGEAIEHTDTVVFVDDEISTGKTICNIIAQLREKYPILSEKKMVAASLLNRLSLTDEERLRSAGIDSAYLLKLAQEDYSGMVENWPIEEVQPLRRNESVPYERWLFQMENNPRCVLSIGEYWLEWERLAQTILSQLSLDFQTDTLVLGTEEAMLPGLLLGRALELRGGKVHFHATTRSPISISKVKDYPVRSGWEVHSLYDERETRRNFIYNLRPYGQVIIVSDTALPEQEHIQSLLEVLRENGCGRIFYIGRGENV